MPLRRSRYRKKKNKAGVDPGSASDSGELPPPDEPDDRGNRAARARPMLSGLVKLARALVTRAFAARIISRRKKGRGAGNDISSGFNVVMRLEGDEPDQQRLVTVALDTQCEGMNLMSFRIWERLNDGRGTLEGADNITACTLGSEPIEILGITRGVEWRFKGGSKTYTSDFYVAKMDRFDVLVGSETIHGHELVKPGSDLERHLNRHN